MPNYIRGSTLSVIHVKLLLPLSIVKVLCGSAQRLLLMKDLEVMLGDCESGHAIEIVNATLAWEKPVTRKGKGEKSKSSHRAVL